MQWYVKQTLVTTKGRQLIQIYVQIVTNVSLIHVTNMLPAPTMWDHTYANVKMGGVVMVVCVLVSSSC